MHKAETDERKYTSINVEASSSLEKEEADGPTEIGKFKVCCYGLTGPNGGPRRAVPREQVELAKEFLSGCRRTRWAREFVSPSAHVVLADAVTEWADDRYIGRITVGAIIVAALELDILIVPQGERDALIGVNHSDVCARATEKMPLVPEVPKEEDWLKQYARENGIAIEGDAEPIKFLNSITPPPSREYAVPDRIPLRQVTLFSGAGGIGKSLVTLQLLCSTVLARDWIGSPPEPGPVIYLGAEDEQDEIHRRLDAIAEHYGESLSDVIGNGLYASSYAGRDMTLARFDRQGRIEPTPLYTALWEQACDIRPVIVALDTLSDIFGGDENDRGQVSAFVGLLRNLAMAANCAVIVNYHPSQAGSNSGTGTSGSTAWHGKVRGRMYLRAANKDEGDTDLRVLEFLKNQYGALAPKVMLRYQNGVFVPEMRGGSADPKIVEQRAEEVFVNLLERFAREGRNVSDKKGTTYAPAAFAKEQEAKAVNLNSKMFESAMRRLFAGNKIRVTIDGPPSKQRSRLVAVRP